ncbi:MAG: pyridoxal-dependent decarboxylase, exosortase A system-associated [Betaproteobacteria bacterium]
MNQFPAPGGELHIGGQPLGALAEKIGRTPFYVYDSSVIASQLAALRAVMPKTLRIHYAVKANPFPPLLALMASLTDGFDIASAGELTLALQSGIQAAKISFAGPGKRREELHQAVAAGVLINIESFREARLLAESTRETGTPARIAIRVNPDFELKSSGMKMSGGAKPFGVDAEQVPELLALLARHGQTVEGFHIYAGSQNLSGEAIAESQRQAYALVRRLAALATDEIRHINLGGGFGIPYFPGERRLDLTPVSAALAEICADAAGRFSGAEVALELGRYLVGEAGAYVTRIVDKKVSRGHTFLVTDGGLNHHLAASGNFGQVIRKNYPVVIGNRMDAPPAAHPVSIVGPLCTPLDILAENVFLPDAEAGDFVVVLQSGAYGASASPVDFLGHPPAAELIL